MTIKTRKEDNIQVGFDDAESNIKGAAATSPPNYANGSIVDIREAPLPSRDEGVRMTNIDRYQWNWLTVPRAHEWKEGLVIVGHNLGSGNSSSPKEKENAKEKKAGSPWYVVAHEKDLRVKGKGNGPNCVAVIAEAISDSPGGHAGHQQGGVHDTTAATQSVAMGNVVAVVRSTNTILSSGFTVYTMEPNYEGQEVSKIDEAPVQYETGYEYGRIHQSALGGTYTFKRTTGPHKGDVITSLSANNRGVSYALLFGCGLPFFCAKWQIRFFKSNERGGRGDDPCIIRDQRDETLTIAPGQDSVIALCLSYATDRLTNPCHSSECKNAVLMIAAYVIGSVAGVVIVRFIFG